MQENSFKFELINYWRNIDKKILLSFLLLFFWIIFFFLFYFISCWRTIKQRLLFFFMKHLSFTILALVIMISLSALNTKLLKKLVLPLFLISLVFLVLVPIIGVEVKGAKRWLDLYFFRLQPIEILKPFFILMTVRILTLDKFKNSQMKYFLSFLLLCLIIILLVGQPDLGQSILLMGSWVFIVFISGVSISFLVAFFSIFAISLSSLLFLLPDKFGYIINRLTTFFFDPNQGDKFQSSSALDAIKLGGLTGQGMGEGILKDSVPEAHTDYVIAIISEEYGSIISIMIILIFLYISFRIIKNCFNQEDQFIKISLCGLATLLIFQTFIRAAVNTNLIPTTGMTLPFLSYGGSSLIGSAILAGIILNYTKNKVYLYD